jgi:hypothetical protein
MIDGEAVMTEDGISDFFLIAAALAKRAAANAPLAA